MNTRSRWNAHHVDTIVVGLGGMGSAAAYHLAQRGTRVLGLEKYTAAHHHGSSHGGSRIIRQSYFEDSAYVPLLLRSYELWEKLAKDFRAEVFRLTGGLFMGAPDSKTVAGSLRASREWSLPYELLDSSEIRRRYPYFTPSPSDIALFEERAGFARPELTVQAHLELAQRAGAELNFNEAVLSWEEKDHGVVVHTSHHSYHADQLILCPGAWAGELLRRFRIPIEVQRQVVFWFDPIGGTAPFEKSPIFIHEWPDSQQTYGFPALDGPRGGVKVAFFRHGSSCLPDTIIRTVKDSEISEIRARIASMIPALESSCVRTSTCMYSTTPDEHFVVARHPDCSYVTLACGFSGHGFKFVPVMGEILADLATTGSTRHPIGLFDPHRFG